MNKFTVSTDNAPCRVHTVNRDKIHFAPDNTHLHGNLRQWEFCHVNCAIGSGPLVEQSVISSGSCCANTTISGHLIDDYLPRLEILGERQVLKRTHRQSGEPPHTRGRYRRVAVAKNRSVKPLQPQIDHRVPNDRFA